MTVLEIKARLFDLIREREALVRGHNFQVNQISKEMDTLLEKLSELEKQAG